MLKCASYQIDQYTQSNASLIHSVTHLESRYAGVSYVCTIRSDLQATATEATQKSFQYMLADKQKYMHVESLSRLIVHVYKVS